MMSTTGKGIRDNAGLAGKTLYQEEGAEEEEVHA